jgi:hypothetical protein
MTSDVGTIRQGLWVRPVETLVQMERELLLSLRWTEPNTKIMTVQDYLHAVNWTGRRRR